MNDNPTRVFRRPDELDDMNSTRVLKQPPAGSPPGRRLPVALRVLWALFRFGVVVLGTVLLAEALGSLIDNLGVQWYGALFLALVLPFLLLLWFRSILKRRAPKARVRIGFPTWTFLWNLLLLVGLELSLPGLATEASAVQGVALARGLGSLTAPDHWLPRAVRWTAGAASAGFQAIESRIFAPERVAARIDAAHQALSGAGAVAGPLPLPVDGAASLPGAAPVPGGVSLPGGAATPGGAAAPGGTVAGPGGAVLPPGSTVPGAVTTPGGAAAPGVTVPGTAGVPGAEAAPGVLGAQPGVAVGAAPGAPGVAPGAAAGLPAGGAQGGAGAPPVASGAAPGAGTSGASGPGYVSTSGPVPAPLPAGAAPAPRSAGVVELPYHVDGNSLLVDVVMNRRWPVRMLVDTGSSFTTLDSIALRQADATPPVNAPTLTVNTARGQHSDALSVIDTLAVGGVELSGVTVMRCDPCAGPDHQGLLGMNVLNNFVFTIDQSAKVLRLEDRRAVYDQRQDIRPFVTLEATPEPASGAYEPFVISAVNKASRLITTMFARLTLLSADRLTVGAQDVRIPPVAPGQRVTVRTNVPVQPKFTYFQLELGEARW